MATTTTAAPAGTVTLEFNGMSLPLPLVEGSEGEIGIDVMQLRARTGMITLDPGFGNSGACKSAITFIDGEKGILRYRGYDITELAAKSTFLEVAWLLVKGELPTRAELDGFRRDVTYHTMLHEDFGRFFEGFPKDAHPMPVCSAAVGALATFYQQPETGQSVRDTVTRLIAKMPTIAAYSYKHSLGQPFIYPQNRLDYCSNFLHMMFATPCETFDVDPVLARAVDLLLILHADHEQNCSTSTVRVVGSSRANLFASIAAGISALWGPLHGGANQEVIEMLDRIEREGGDVQKFVDRAKDKKDNSRLMGFGHRVYKNYDPRAAILKGACRDVLEKLGVRSRQLEIAMTLEELALKDEYFISHKLYPNVDFYSGIIYRALGIPVNMFTVMFTLGRLPGWIAHWLEMRSDPETRIVRPRQIYTGPTRRAYVPVESRT
ncbi:MAG TPA: citrate synthase [Vicinamibacterales bacterium]|nr:citrate synthase [Vicinamibacterales bacterium]